MNARIVIAAVIGTLLAAHPHLAPAVPVLVIAAGAVAAACGVLTLLAVRALSRTLSCPHPHPAA